MKKAFRVGQRVRLRKEITLNSLYGIGVVNGARPVLKKTEGKIICGTRNIPEYFVVSFGLPGDKEGYCYTFPERYLEKIERRRTDGR